MCCAFDTLEYVNDGARLKALWWEPKLFDNLTVAMSCDPSLATAAGRTS